MASSIHSESKISSISDRMRGKVHDDFFFFFDKVRRGIKTSLVNTDSIVSIKPDKEYRKITVKQYRNRKKNRTILKSMEKGFFYEKKPCWKAQFFSIDSKICFFKQFSIDQVSIIRFDFTFRSLFIRRKFVFPITRLIFHHIYFTIFLILRFTSLLCVSFLFSLLNVLYIINIVNDFIALFTSSI